MIPRTPQFVLPRLAMAVLLLVFMVVPSAHSHDCDSENRSEGCSLCLTPAHYPLLDAGTQGGEHLLTLSENLHAAPIEVAHPHRFVLTQRLRAPPCS